MYQPNVSRKTTSAIQVWGCLLLAIISVFLSFAPLVTLDTGVKGVTDMLEDLDMDFGEDYDIPEKVEVSAPKLIGSISLIVQVIQTAKNPDDQEKLDALQERMESDDAKNTLLTAVAIAATVTNSFVSQDEDTSFLGLILTVVITIIGLLCVFLLTLAFPITYLVIALTSLFSTLKHRKDLTLAAPKLSKKLPGTVTVPLAFMLFQCVVPGMDIAYGATGLWIVAAICTLLNFVVSRLRRYTDKECVYATVVQAGSILGGVGFVVFFFNIIKTGIFETFVTGGWAGYAAEVAADKKVAFLAGESLSIGAGYWIDVVLMFVYLTIILSSSAYFAHCVQRVSCAATKGKKQLKITDNHIVFAVFLVIGCVIPMYLKGTQNLYRNVVEQTDAYGSLNMTDAQTSVLTTALIGAIIMLVAEILIVVLKKALCSELTEDERIAVITGNAKEPEAAVAEEPAVAAAVVVEEAPVEAAPAEETPVEEAPAEEAPEAEKTEE